MFNKWKFLYASVVSDEHADVIDVFRYPFLLSVFSNCVPDFEKGLLGQFPYNIELDIPTHMF